MTQDQRKELNKLADKVVELGSTWDLTTSERRRFEILVEILNAELRAEEQAA